MDERRQEWIMLKKQSVRMKRKYVAFWKTAAVAVLILLLLSILLYGLLNWDRVSPELPGTEKLHETVANVAERVLFFVKTQIAPQMEHAKVLQNLYTALQIAMASLAGMFGFFTVMWIFGKRSWKRTEAYLNFRTMQNTFRIEKRIHKI